MAPPGPFLCTDADPLISSSSSASTGIIGEPPTLEIFDVKSMGFRERSTGNQGLASRPP